MTAAGSKLASSPDSQTQKALQRFADGEPREALDDLDMIADAKHAAHDKAVVIANAAERRPTAWLAVQALDAGKVTLDEVLEWFEKLTRLDPGRPGIGSSWDGCIPSKGDSPTSRRRTNLRSGASQPAMNEPGPLC